MKINFKKGEWEDKLVYAYTYRYKNIAKFKQEKDHIKNCKDKTKENEFENISLFFKDKKGAGTKLTTTCSFDSYGAPLICLAEDLVKQKDGTLKFGNYYEIVIYEQGVNVWDLKYDGKKVNYYKMAGFTFKLDVKKKHKLTTELKNGRLYIEVGRHKMQVGVPHAKIDYYWGIDACEGINRFYDITIE